MEAALFREESRGGHFRTDIPSKQPFWQRHSVQQIGKAIHTAAVDNDGARFEGFDQKPLGPL
jgi:L-aspartate oxidase